MPCCRAHIESLVTGREPLEEPIGSPPKKGEALSIPESGSHSNDYRIHMNSAHDPRAPQGLGALYHLLSFVKGRNNRFEHRGQIFLKILDIRSVGLEFCP